MKKLVLLVMLVFAGCPQAYVPPAGPVPILKTAKRQCMLIIGMDTSGSFMEEMFGSDGRGYEFTLQAIDRLFRQRFGEDDRVLLAQLSTGESLLWEGSPLSMKKRFKSASSMKDFVLQNSGQGGSNLFAGIAETLSYVSGLPGVAEGQTQTCVLVLSDMEDNSPTQEEDRKRMVEELRAFKGLPGGIGFYFVSTSRMEDTRNCLMDAGLDPSLIECGIVENPPLPSFEQ